MQGKINKIKFNLNSPSLSQNITPEKSFQTEDKKLENIREREECDNEKGVSSSDDLISKK